jgi:hypothetical protein
LDSLKLAELNGLSLFELERRRFNNSKPNTRMITMTTTTTMIKVIDELPPLEVALWAERANAELIDAPLKLIGVVSPSYPSLVMLKEY